MVKGAGLLLYPPSRLLKITTTMGIFLVILSWNVYTTNINQVTRKNSIFRGVLVVFGLSLLSLHFRRFDTEDNILRLIHDYCCTGATNPAAGNFWALHRCRSLCGVNAQNYGNSILKDETLSSH